MEIVDEIRSFFASQIKRAKKADSLPQEYPGYIIRDNNGFGVAVEWNKDVIISEHFANAHLFTTKSFIGGEEKSLIILQSFREDLRNEFASVCAQFLYPGANGHERSVLMTDPLEWWANWKELLGNSISDMAAYSVLGEMIVLEHLYSMDKTVLWTATKAGTHDIESDTHSYEVKSTIKRYDAEVTISGQFQLLTPKPLDLFFCRMEPSPTGKSINDIAKNLISLGYDKAKLEHELSLLGYELGRSTRDRKYSILQKRYYHVDDSFPKIVEDSFLNGKIPHGVKHITYTVDLDVPEYFEW